eukprot:475704_1
MTATNSEEHILWLLKLTNLTNSSPPSSTNVYIPQMVYNFANELKTALLSNKDIELIYIAKGEGSVMTSKQTDLPSTKWDIIVVTRHINDNNYKSFINNKQFKNITNKYPLSHQYYVPFEMTNIPKIYSFLAKTSELISKLLGYLFTFNPTFGYFPSYPFHNGSYDVLSEGILGESKDEELETFKTLFSIKNQPFLMLNLMEITDKKADKKYTWQVLPLLHASGGRIQIFGVPKNHFNQLGFVYYPNTRQFWNMVSSTNYVKCKQDKVDSLNDVLVMLTIPMYCHPKYIYGAINSKL